MLRRSRNAHLLIFLSSQGDPIFERLLAGAGATAARGHDERNDETVETQRLGEDENKNHADEELGLLSRCPYTRVTNDTDSHTRSKTRETAGQA